jgi:hypothetical protein
LQVRFYLSTTNKGGASALLDPVSHRLEIGLGEYGVAIEEIEVLVVLGAVAGQLVPLRQGHHPKLPYRRFMRAKKQLKIGFLSADHAEDIAPEECDPRATAAILPEVEDALLGWEGSLKPDDDFDFARFAADVKELLGRGFDSAADCRAEEAEVLARRDAANAPVAAAEAAQRAATPAAEAENKIHSYAIRVRQEDLDAVEGDPVVYQNQFACIGDWVEFALRNQLRGLGTELTLELVPSDAPREMLAEWVVSAPFDRAAFDAEADPVAKRRRIAETCRDTLSWFAERWGQDPAPVHALFAEMEEADFLRTGTLRAKIEPRSGAFEARIEFVHHLDGFELTAAFVRRGKRKVESRAPLGHCRYHPLLLSRFHEFCRFERGELVVEVPALEWTARAKPGRKQKA